MPYSAIILGASGACMDIAASMDEIKQKKSDIHPFELIRSGFSELLNPVSCECKI